MSKDEIYVKLCEIFWNEEVRLQNKLDQLEYLSRYRINDSHIQVELIETRANLAYFKTYINDILKYLEIFDRE